MYDVEYERQNDVLTVFLKGEIDHHTAKHLSRSIDAELLCGDQTSCVLDFSGVGFMDSSGIGLILGRHKLLRSSSQDMRVAGVSSQMEKILKIAGIAY